MTQCHYCQLPSALTVHVQTALYEKHCASASFNCLFPIESILQDDLSSAAVHFREMSYLSQDNECLKRVYGQWQFPSKISQLSEYYKFSRDLPRFHDPMLLRTMERYYQKIRELDFRKVKAAVKKEQGISLTSLNSESSMSNSQEEVRSKYSNVLQELSEDSHSESNLFGHFCQEIQDAFPEQAPQQSAIKGFFPEQNLKQFQQFIDKQQKKSKVFCFKKQKPTTSTDKTQHNKENTIKNGINLIRQSSKKSVFKKISEKTRANDTLSREERSKRMEKTNLLKTIDCPNIFRSTLTAFHKKQVTKTFEQIYKIHDQQQSKYNSGKQKKMSVMENKRKKSSLCKGKKPQLIQNNFILDTERNRQQRKSITKTSIQKSIEQRPKRQPSFKALPVDFKEKAKERERTLSRSKSRAKMSRQGSRESVKAKPLSSAHSGSRLSSTLPQKEIGLRQDKKIERLLSKKLALFKK